MLSPHDVVLGRRVARQRSLRAGQTALAIGAQRHIRGAVGGMVAGVFGDGRLFVSGGAEHQGPDGVGFLQ